MELRSGEEDSEWETNKSIAESFMGGSLQVEHEWPRVGRSCVVSLDLVGRNAAMWVATAESATRISGRIVHLYRVEESWRVNSIQWLDDFSVSEKTILGPSVYEWSAALSFRVNEPIGAVMVWGRAGLTTSEVEFGFGFSVPRRRRIEAGTGCFLLIQEVDQEAASIFRTLQMMDESASQPILRVWASNGFGTDVSYG